jgi:hypothetical protein
MNANRKTIAVIAVIGTNRRDRKTGWPRIDANQESKNKGSVRKPDKFARKRSPRPPISAQMMGLRTLHLRE